MYMQGSILDQFDALCSDISKGLPAEIEARQKQYEYYRDELLKPKDNIPMVTLKDIATDIYRGSGIKRDQVTEVGIPCVRYDSSLRQQLSANRGYRGTCRTCNP